MPACRLAFGLPLPFIDCDLLSEDFFQRLLIETCQIHVAVLSRGGTLDLAAGHDRLHLREEVDDEHVLLECGLDALQQVFRSFFIRLDGFLDRRIGVDFICCLNFYCDSPLMIRNKSETRLFQHRFRVEPV